MLRLLKWSVSSEARGETGSAGPDTMSRDEGSVNRVAGPVVGAESFARREPCPPVVVPVRDGRSD